MLPQSLPGVLGLMVYLFTCTVLIALGELLRSAWREAAKNQERLEKEAKARREAERAVAESEELLRAFLNSSPIVCTIKDHEGRYVFINRAQEEVVRRPAADWLGKTSADIFSEDEARQLEANDQVAWSADSGRHFEETFEDDGRLRQFVSYRFPLTVAGGRRWLGCFSREVTELRASEDQLRRRESELRLCLKIARMGTWEFDPSTRLVITSGSTDELYGLEPAGGRLRTIDEYMAAVHPDDRDRLLRVTEEAARESREILVEYRLLRPDGSVRWIVSRGDILRDDEGQVLRMVGALADITEQKTAEQVLEEADQRKNEFIATLAHELRNPLAPIRNAAHLLQTASTTPEDIRWCREAINRQVEHMSRLLDDLLDVSRITLKKLELRRTRTTLQAIVEPAVEASRPAIESGGHQLVLKMPPEDVWLVADGVRIAQVITNLLNNSAKYTEPGGRIELEASVSQNKEIEMCVSDNGIGMPSDVLTSVFDLFTQAHPGKSGGLGIGLALARELVELHGGRITAFSEGTGRGCRFEVSIPGVCDAPEALPVAEKAGTGSTPRRVLVVDDLRDSADSMALLLQTCGYEVKTAYGGLRALEVAETFHPDLVFLDIGMSDLGGLETCRRLRARPWGSSAYVVALTGWGQEDDRRKTAEAGFDHHLVKPVHLDVFLGIARNAFRKEESGA